MIRRCAQNDGGAERFVTALRMTAVGIYRVVLDQHLKIAQGRIHLGKSRSLAGTEASCRASPEHIPFDTDGVLLK